MNSGGSPTTLLSTPSELRRGSHATQAALAMQERPCVSRHSASSPTRSVSLLPARAAVARGASAASPKASSACRSALTKWVARHPGRRRSRGKGVAGLADLVDTTVTKERVMLTAAGSGPASWPGHARARALPRSQSAKGRHRGPFRRRRQLPQADGEGEQRVEHLRIGEGEEECCHREAEQRSGERLGELCLPIGRVDPGRVGWSRAAQPDEGAREDAYEQHESRQAELGADLNERVMGGGPSHPDAE